MTKKISISLQRHLTSKGVLSAIAVLLLLLASFSLFDEARSRYEARQRAKELETLTVVTPATIESFKFEKLTEIDNNESIQKTFLVLDVSFTKKEDCEFITIQTYSAKNADRTAFRRDVKNFFTTSVGSRPEGNFFIEGWYLETDLPISQIIADAVHDCDGILIYSPFIN